MLVAYRPCPSLSISPWVDCNQSQFRLCLCCSAVKHSAYLWYFINNNGSHLTFHTAPAQVRLERGLSLQGRFAVQTNTSPCTQLWGAAWSPWALCVCQRVQILSSPPQRKEALWATFWIVFAVFPLPGFEISENQKRQAAMTVKKVSKQKGNRQHAPCLVMWGWSGLGWVLLG